MVSSISDNSNCTDSLNFSFVVDLFHFDCWHRIDFTGLRKDLERRWLVCQVPEGEKISIFGLATVICASSIFCVLSEE